MNKIENVKVHKKKRYKQTQELWGELMSWLTIIASISLLTMASFGSKGSFNNIKNIRIFQYLIPSFMILFGILYSWVNRKANISNSLFWFKILRVMGITSLLISFGYSIFLITTNAMGKSSTIEYSIWWLALNLIVLSGITIISYITISWTDKIEKDEVKKVYTDEITIKEVVSEDNNDKKSAQNDAILAAINSYKKSKK